MHSVLAKTWDTWMLLYDNMYVTRRPNPRAVHVVQMQDGQNPGKLRAWMTQSGLKALLTQPRKLDITPEDDFWGSLYTLPLEDPDWKYTESKVT